ncbi:transglycosylase domain-containing protein [Saccharothrix coeruleofusca]|uniref:transglycosylase domain-containing protein n=1 Tax=Saccharothrix coeruleofusca TaxID=33919 RepID=UPI00227D97C4|nr:transglycosylase domain-containing protein [Saccharothrix coeruleofusca]
MNDQHDDRHRGGEPQWPTGEDPDGGAQPPRYGAQDQPERPSTPPGGFARPQPPRQGTPPGGFARPQGGGTPPRGIPQGQPPLGGPGQPPRGQAGPPPPPPGGPAPGGPQAGQGGPAQGGPGPQRPATPPGGARRPGPAGPVPPGGRPPAGGPGGPRRPGGPGPERRPADEPTDLLAPVQPPVAEREPQLLTHREPDEEVIEAYYDDEDEYDDEELTDEEARALRRKKIWRRVRRVSYVVLGLMVLSPLVAFAIAYQIVDVPIPEQVAAQQGKAITVLYSDGSEMTKIAPHGANRSLVKYEELPDTVKNAVFAAEDPTFMTNPGFDIKAIARAGWYQLTDRDSGGSGLTQQYIKQATEEDDLTLTRKFNEIVKAYKMSKQQGKPEILTAYLNTIYFGRSAYGIKTAAEMYYGKQLAELTPSEAALLAGMIQNPGRSEDEAYTKERWEYVMGQMVEHKMIDQAYRDSQTFPTIKPLADVQQFALEGPLAHVQNQIEQEMAKHNVPRNVAQKRGAVVHTTIDPAMQKAADEAVNEIMANQPEELKYSLTAIDPNTGAVRAYWAGKDGNGIDYAKGTIQEAGSSFKPFDLVAALKMGKGLGSTYDGTSPRTFPGLKDPIRNATDPNNSCGKECPIREAMRLSLNTVFYDMVLNDTGAQAVADAAHQAGIPESVIIEGKERKLLVGENGGRPNVGISLGGDDAQVRPFDMASAYATFAARGVYREPFFITKITDAEGDVLVQPPVVERPAFDPDPQKSRDIADNVTEALKVIPTSSKIGCAGGRECAGKTGTHELPDNASQNSKAWMVGYTPSLSAAVWMGRNEGNVALQDARGNAIFGSGLPGKIWQKFMDKALANSPKETFPKAKPLGQFENPRKVVSSAPSSTPKKEDDRKEDRSRTSTPTAPSVPESSAPPSIPTRPGGGRPCGVLCTSDPPPSSGGERPDPISDPTR